MRVYKIRASYSEVRGGCMEAEVTDKTARLGRQSGLAFRCRAVVPRDEVFMSPSEAVADALRLQRREIAGIEDDLAAARSCLAKIEAVGREWTGAESDLGEVVHREGGIERRP